MKQRKPRATIGRSYPRVEVEEGRIWMQNTPSGTWKKVPPGRALDLADRLTRARAHVLYKKGA